MNFATHFGAHRKEHRLFFRQKSHVESSKDFKKDFN